MSPLLSLTSGSRFDTELPLRMARKGSRLARYEYQSSFHFTNRIVVPIRTIRRNTILHKRSNAYSCRTIVGSLAECGEIYCLLRVARKFTFANVSIRKETRKVDERDLVGGTKHCTRQTCCSTPKRSGKVHS
jgi:hypothetical protein